MTIAIPSKTSGWSVDWGRFLPAPFVVGLLLLAQTPDVRGHGVLLATFLVVAGTLGLWQLGLYWRSSQAAVEWRPRAPHYVQMLMHASIYLYWGWHWPQVYDQAELILAQVLFAYAFDLLLSWTRGRPMVLGFGPIPIVLSTNLFLWFRDDWFYFQFAMIAVAYLAKHFLRWQREGVSTHIFNPSSFPLAFTALALILTGSTGITWGEDIASHLGDPPHMYLWIFAVGLIVQTLFGITLITASAAVTLVLLNLAYTAATGVYYFLDSTIPVAVFLGMHLLITDPATSPRSELGKALFGAGYALGVFALYSILGWFGAPTFFDKLLAVPLLNLAVIAIDHWCRSPVLLARSPWRLAPGVGPRGRNLAYVGLWVLLFAVMNRSGLVARGHPGQDPAFWRQACTREAPKACRNLLIMQRSHCLAGASDACLDVAWLAQNGLGGSEGFEVAAALRRACDLGEIAGCRQLVAAIAGEPVSGDVRRDKALFDLLTDAGQLENQGSQLLPTLVRACDLGDGRSCFLLAQAYRAGLGVPRDLGRSRHLLERSCTAEWPAGCAALGQVLFRGAGVPRDVGGAADAMDKACAGGEPASCADLGVMLQRGLGVPQDPDRGGVLLGRACALGLDAACQALEAGSGAE